MPTCQNCGFNDHSGFLARRLERHLEPVCASCAARPAKTVLSDFGVCRPHQGAFDDEDNPLDRWGKWFRPGTRLCGNRDCIEPAHIRDGK